MTDAEPPADQTEIGDYQYIKYKTFKPCPQKRLMWWNESKGRIATGGVSYNTNTPNNTDGMVLPANQAVVVYDTHFKLLKT